MRMIHKCARILIVWVISSPIIYGIVHGADDSMGGLNDDDFGDAPSVQSQWCTPDRSASALHTESEIEAEQERVKTLIRHSLKDSLYRKTKTVMIHHQNIFALPTDPHFWQYLVRLESFFVFNNDLTELPNIFGIMTQLTELYLSNNKLRNLPPSIGLLEHLEHLDLSSNCLEEIPKEMAHLTSLTGLILSRNQFKRLSSFIECLPELERLEVASNPFNDDETMEMLQRLKAKGILQNDS